MLSSHSSLSFSSADPAALHPRLPPRPHNHPKSRSKLHHHLHQQHRHQQPSWSSSRSAFSLQQQRASGFLIDEYGNEHDPEHCRFKTLATATRHARSSTSSSSASSRSSASLRSSASSTGSSTGTTDPSPPSSSTHSSHLPAHLALSHTHTLPSAGPAGARPSCWSSLRPHGRRAKPAADSAPARWTKTLWAHLRPAPPDAPPPRTHAYHLHHPTHPIFSIPVAPFPHPAHPRRKRLLCPSDPASNSLPLSALRKRLELVKLEVRFGILRTRKRVLGVWKQQTACKKP